jgi:SAM-dependent methyltransferase
MKRTAVNLLKISIRIFFLIFPLITVIFSTNLQTKETTIRNVTNETIEYKIKPHRSEDPPETKVIKIGDIHRYPGDKALDISFQRADKIFTLKIDPGLPYSFRYNERNNLELYPGSHGREDAEDLAPYAVTPMFVVDKMLQLAEVSSEDIVYDIGCGDGRIIITAALEYGTKGVGIDIDPKRIQESRRAAAEALVEHLVEFRQEDATKSDLSPATVVTMYLLPESNELLRPILERMLKPGTRVVSHAYLIPGWEDKLDMQVTLGNEYDGLYLIYLYRR